MLPDETREERMEWWRDARFGLFIHWGLYAIPAGEWKGEVSRKNYAEWAMHNFQIPVDEYKELAKEFNPTEFDPELWAELADEAGMGYFVLTTKHHDGFAMFDSEASDYNVVDATPFGRDVFGELAEAFRKRGMRVGAYYSQDIDWSVPQGTISNYNTWDFDVKKGDYGPFDKYMYEKSLPQVEEITTNYGPVDVIWFDVPRMVERERGKLFHDKVREHQPQAVISGRIAVPQGIYADYLVPGDNGFYTSPQDFDWECCATMNESWGYTKHEKEARSSDYIIMVLLKTVSSGGNLLLNVGPKPDGTIPQEQIDILKDIGVWMKDNKESIHGADANPFGEYFNWGLCTVKGTDIYMHITHWVDGETIHLERLKNKVKSVEVLGAPDRKLKWSRDGTDLDIILSGEAVHSSATVIKVSCSGDSLDIEPLEIKGSDGELVLETRFAKSRGQRMSTLRHSNQEGQAVADLSGGHTSERLIWDFDAIEPGTYSVVAEYLEPESNKLKNRTVYLINTEGAETATEVNSASLENGKLALGEITFDKPDDNQLSIRVQGGRPTPIYLKALHLTKQ